VNQEQLKSVLRSLIQTFGGVIAGWFAAKGWFTVDQVLTVLNSPTLLGIVTSIIAATWGMLSHSTTNIVAVANALPEVQGVITTSTVAGKALAESIPADTVAVAGTSAATAVAKPT